MLSRCLKYLTLPALQSRHCVSSDELGKRYKGWPLFHHAAKIVFDALASTPLDKPIKPLNSSKHACRIEAVISAPGSRLAVYTRLLSIRTASPGFNLGYWTLPCIVASFPSFD